MVNQSLNNGGLHWAELRDCLLLQPKQNTTKFSVSIFNFNFKIQGGKVKSLYKTLEGTDSKAAFPTLMR